MFYPLQAPLSEEYVIYDVKDSKGSWSAAMTAGDRASEPDDIGRLVYPKTDSDAPFAAAHVPEARTHRFEADAFYWAADGRSVAFADSVSGTMSLVLLRIRDLDHVDARVQAVSPQRVCRGPAANRPGTYVALSGAQVVNLADGSQDVQATFRSSDPGCDPGVVTFFWNDFKAAAREDRPQFQRSPMIRVEKPR
jgi:hypothetical protein